MWADWNKFWGILKQNPKRFRKFQIVQKLINLRSPNVMDAPREEQQKDYFKFLKIVINYKWLI